MPKTIKVAVITQADGAHLPDYFGSLAKIDEAEGVALVDPSGKSAGAARKLLDDVANDALNVAVIAFIGGSLYGVLGYFLGGLLLYALTHAVGGATYRQAPHGLAFASAPVAGFGAVDGFVVVVAGAGAARVVVAATAVRAFWRGAGRC